MPAIADPGAAIVPRRAGGCLRLPRRGPRVAVFRRGPALLILEPYPLRWEQRLALLEALQASDLPFRVDVVEVPSVPAAMRERILAEAVAL